MQIVKNTGRTLYIAIHYNDFVKLFTFENHYADICMNALFQLHLNGVCDWVFCCI